MAELTITLRLDASDLLRTLAFFLESPMSDNTAATDAAIAKIRARVNEQTTVIGGFAAFLSAHDDALRAALNSARAAGATDAQLADLTKLADDLGTNTTTLTADLTARTPMADATPAPATDPTPTTSGTITPTPVADPVSTAPAPAADPAPTTTTPAPAADPATTLTDSSGASLTDSSGSPVAEHPAA